MIRVALLRMLAFSVAVSPAGGVFAQPTAGQVVLTGAVRSESGEPLRGARVLVRVEAGGIAGQVLADEDGRFETRVAEGAPYALVVSKAGYAPVQARVDGVSTGEHVEVRLSKGAVVTGRISDETGYPVPGVGVRLRPAGIVGAPIQFLRLSTITDDQGEYRLGSLPAGQYRMEIEPSAPVASVDGWFAANAVAQRAAARAAATRADAGGDEPTAVDVQAGEERFVNLVDNARRADHRLLAASRVEGLTMAAEAAVRSQTAVITGRVLDWLGRPVATAVVTLVTEAGGTSAAAASVEDGWYEFASVPEGTYRIAAQHPDFLPGEHGTARGTSRDRWRNVEAGDRLEGMDVVLSRGGVIAGTVADAYGEPLEGLTVHVLRSRVRNGREEVFPASELRPRQTDDRGRYRLYGLPPGPYYVVARDSREPAGPARVPDARAVLASDTPRDGVQWAGPAAYYPGRGTIQNAQVVHVTAGSDVLGVDFEFAPTPSAAVSGRVVNSSGEPLRALVKLALSRRSGAPLEQAQEVVSNADGLFEFQNVPPGEYVLQTERRTLLLIDPAGAQKISSRIQPETAWQFGTQFVSVAESDAGPVLLRTSPGSNLIGRLVLEGPGGSPPPSAFSLDFVAADPDLAPARLPVVRFNAEGVFLASNLVGPFRIVGNAPAGWWLKSVFIGGVDATEQPVTFGAQEEPRADVEAVFSSARTIISGRVLAEGNERAVGAHVIAFPVEAGRRFAGAPYFRRTPAIGGEFSVSALPPGDYYFVSVPADSIGPLEWVEADVLQRLTPFATLARVREGQSISMNLQQVRLP
jgi:protocatechuate 3,4-dioxygenase beta subunit